MTSRGSEWDDAPVDHGAPPPAAANDEPGVVLRPLEEWLVEFLFPTLRRRVGERGQYRWASDWWHYPEAVLRLDALLRPWEHLRLDPALGMAT